MKSDELGRIAFEAYSKQRAGKAVDGSDIPSWDNLKEEIAEAWIAAAVSVFGYIVDKTIKEARGEAYSKGHSS